MAGRNFAIATTAAAFLVVWWRLRKGAESAVGATDSEPTDEDLVVAALQSVQARVAAADGSGRVTLIAVSKTKPASLVAAAHATGQMDFGENYVQEVMNDTLGMTPSVHNP